MSGVCWLLFASTACCLMLVARPCWLDVAHEPPTDEAQGAALGLLWWLEES